MNRFFHSWNCNECDSVGYTEVNGMLHKLPEELHCRDCGSDNLSKMSNHLNQIPSDEHLLRIKNHIKSRN